MFQLTTHTTHSTMQRSGDVLNNRFAPEFGESGGFEIENLSRVPGDA